MIPPFGGTTAPPFGRTSPTRPVAPKARCRACCGFAYHGPFQAPVSFAGYIHHPTCPIIAAIERRNSRVVIGKGQRYLFSPYKIDTPQGIVVTGLGLVALALVLRKYFTSKP
jgi:hypothetical protein